MVCADIFLYYLRHTKICFESCAYTNYIETLIFLFLVMIPIVTLNYFATRFAHLLPINIYSTT